MKVIDKEDLQLVIACLENKTYNEGELLGVLERFGDDYFVGDSRELEKVEGNTEMKGVKELAYWRYRHYPSQVVVPIACMLVCPACARSTHRPEGINYKYCPHCGARIKEGVDHNAT